MERTWGATTLTKSLMLLIAVKEFLNEQCKAEWMILSILLFSIFIIIEAICYEGKYFKGIPIINLVAVLIAIYVYKRVVQVDIIFFLSVVFLFEGVGTFEVLGKYNKVDILRIRSRIISIIIPVILGVYLRIGTLNLLLGIGLVIYLYYLKNKHVTLYEAIKENDELKITIEKLYKKLGERGANLQEMQEYVALEERRKLTTQVHDSLGHSISGSVIQVEAIRMIMEEEPNKAKQMLGVVQENLRKGVDDIRIILKENKPLYEEIGINKIRTSLKDFEETYGIKTHIEVVGELHYIIPSLWQCIYKNLQECLTNTIKHSDSRRFTIYIQVLPKLINVEYSNDGVVTQRHIVKGMGVSSIEERTAVLGGKVKIKTSEGFKLQTIFYLASYLL